MKSNTSLYTQYTHVNREEFNKNCSLIRVTIARCLFFVVSIYRSRSKQKYLRFRFCSKLKRRKKPKNRIYPKTWKSGTQPFCSFIFHNFDTKKKTKGGRGGGGETNKTDLLEHSNGASKQWASVVSCARPHGIYCTTCCGFNVNVVFHTRNSWCLTLCASTTYEKRTQMGIKPNWEWVRQRQLSRNTQFAFLSEHLKQLKLILSLTRAQDQARPNERLRKEEKTFVSVKQCEQEVSLDSSEMMCSDCNCKYCLCLIFCCVRCCRRYYSRSVCHYSDCNENPWMAKIATFQPNLIPSVVCFRVLVVWVWVSVCSNIIKEFNLLNSAVVTSWEKTFA